MRFVFFLLTAALSTAGVFSTSLGDANPYTVSAITTDSAGNTYIVGSRLLGLSNPYTISILVNPVTGSQSYAPTGSDVFVSKLDPNGKLLFTDTFAGKGLDTGTAIALDPSGNIYIAGTTTSTDFPLSKALQTQPNPTDGTGFIIKLSNDGSTILYSTYFGGTLGATSISSLATDAQGNLYLTGSTTAADFPHTAGLPFGPFDPSSKVQPAGAIMTSISAAGDKILYSGALVGTPIPNSGLFPQITTTGAGIAVDAAGNAYIAGNSTLNLPTTPGVLTPKGVGAFVAKVNASGLSYLTYLGSEVNIDEMSPSATVGSVLYSIAVDAAGNAYLAGATSDPKFPTTPGSFLPGFHGLSGGPGLPPVIYEGFLAKLKPDASGMVWATYLDRGNALSTGTFVQSISPDAAGNVWAVGITGGIVFPSPTGVSTGPEFVVALNAAGSALIYQSNDPMGTVAQSVSVDPSGLAHVAGIDGFVSTVAPAAPPMEISYLANAAGGIATARISPAEVISIYGTGLGSSTGANATPVNGFYPTTFDGVQVTMNGTNIPLLYVSQNQINAVVPMELAVNSAATLRVINGTSSSPAFPVWIVASAAQAFASVANQDGSLNTPSNPAKSGSVVSIYATGWQSSFAPLADGQVATTAQDFCIGACQAIAVRALVPLNLAVLYGGTAPGMVAGITQFNVHLGTAASTVNFGIILEIYGQASFTQTVWYQP